MPIFDYSCQSCGHIFDILQKLGADPLTECPECGEHELKKCLSAPAFHLKGKGWRKSDDTPKKPDVRPRFGHTLDSPVAHAEHTHDGPAKPDGHSHQSGGGVGRIVREHVKSHNHDQDHGHSHSHDRSQSSDKKHKHDH